MDIEPNDAPVVDTSDDLDTFSDDFFSVKKEEAPVEKKEDVTPATEDDTETDGKEEEPDLDGDKDDEPAPKKKINRYQERINELTAKAKEAERALEALRVERESQKSTQQPTPAVVNDGPNPDAKNEDGSDKYPLGEFDPSYIRDMARNTIDKEWAARKEQDAQELGQRQEQEARDYLQTQWVEKLAPVTEQHEDFLDKTMELESAFEGLDGQYSDYLVQTIKSLDHGPEVLYYFANNLDEAQKFVKMGPLAATLALGEYNAMFKGTTKKETKVSNAPPPPQVNKGSKTRMSVAGDTDDLDAFSDMFFKKR